MVSGWKFLPFCTPTETPFRLFLINWRIWLANPVLTIFPTHLPRQYQGKVWVTAKGSNFFFFSYALTIIIFQSNIKIHVIIVL